MKQERTRKKKSLQKKLATQSLFRKRCWKGVDKLSTTFMGKGSKQKWSRFWILDSKVSLKKKKQINRISKTCLTMSDSPLPYVKCQKPMPEGGFVRVSVGEAQNVGSHHEYKISLETNLPEYGKTQFCQMKRYSDFHELGKNLSKLDPDLPSLPSKAFKNGKQKVLSQRQEGFQKYLDVVLSSPRLNRCPIILAFFGQKYDPRSVIQLSEGEWNGVTGVKTFQINLDLSPEDRWIEVVTAFRQELKGVEELVEQFMRDNLGSAGNTFASGGSKIFSLLVNSGVGMYSEELRAISKLADVPLGKLTCLQLMYEASIHCTSIIAKGKDGEVIHGRTLDWDVSFLRPLLVNYEFYKEGALLFKGPSWAGFCGLFTGIKPNAFSISVNYRKTEEGTFFVNLRKAPGKSVSVGTLVRHVFETSKDYNSALKCLKETQLIAPTFFIIAGVNNEGAVITRSRSKCIGTRSLGANRNYIVQTNLSSEGDVPSSVEFEDDNMDSTTRARVGVACMEEYGPELNEEDMWKTLSEPPIWNHPLTKFACVMNPRRGTLETRLPNIDSGFLKSKCPAPLLGEPRLTCRHCKTDFIALLNPSGFCVGKDPHEAW